jgi:hypothetical protein
MADNCAIIEPQRLVERWLLAGPLAGCDGQQRGNLYGEAGYTRYRCALLFFRGAKSFIPD